MSTGNKGNGGWQAVANHICSALLILFGATMVLGTILQASESHKFSGGDAAGVLFLGGIPIVLGALWIRRTLGAARRAGQEQTERQVLGIAMRSGGVVTPMQVAAETDLSLDEVKRYLDGLADKGLVELTPGEHGMSYRFRDAGA